MYGYSGVASLEAVQFKMQFLELECGNKDELFSRTDRNCRALYLLTLDSCDQCLKLVIPAGVQNMLRNFYSISGLKTLSGVYGM